MLCTLEALQADHGDSLILHYGPKSKPRFIVIDGGPTGIYKNVLEKRLAEIKERWSPDAALPIEMLMVSHIDDDHINGVLALMRDLADKHASGEAQPYAIGTLWHNGFDDILGNVELDMRSELVGAAAAASRPAPAVDATLSKAAQAVVASVPQGRQLRQQAELLTVAVNRPFKGLVMARDEKVDFDFDPHLKFTVLGPSEQRVRKLHKEWEKNLKKDKAKALAAAFDDKSPFNLSSIVVLAEIGGKRLLLTGDARGDHIMEGMSQAGLLANGTCHVDLLKVPHHGSDRNVTTEFFRQITAAHYVISANGRDDNPSIPTLEMIAEARTDDDFTLHLTNRSGKNDLGKHLDGFIAAQKAKGRKFGFVFRADAARSLKVDLLEQLTY